jgi:DNA primase large subunit
MTIEALQKSKTMAHLLDALEAGEDIGHYGRLTFAMVARHFLSEAELIDYLQKDQDFSEREARALVQQVQGKDYNPPKRERILEWQSQQDFPICPDSDDPDACNLYQELQFPDHVYEHISQYYEQKAG